jgi:hypothetical protein
MLVLSFFKFSDFVFDSCGKDFVTLIILFLTFILVILVTFIIFLAFLFVFSAFLLECA